MKVQILTPDAHIYEGEAELVTLPGADGSFQVLGGHAPMISILQAGTVEVQARGGAAQQFATTGGVVEVLNDEVAVLVETSSRPEPATA